MRRSYGRTPTTSGTRGGTWPNLGRVRNLVLMRHAKSGYPDGVADHERPLAPRGEREAALAGQWLRDRLPPVEAVLCSSAERTRQTLARTGIGAPATFLERLYGASPGEMLGEINGVDDAVGTLLVVGHEPTVSSLTLGLAGAGSERAALDAVARKFPTSAIALLGVPGSWSSLEAAGANLVTFHVPR